MSTQTEELVRLHYPVIAPLIMCEGIGDGKTTACVMAQAATIDELRKGRTLDAPTDKLECACPVMRLMAIQANDAPWWKGDAERTEYLRPLIPLLLDSRVSREIEQKRLYKLVDNAVRVVTPMRMEFHAELSKSQEFKARVSEWAKTLRDLPEIADKASCLVARDRCLNIHSAASAASAAYAAYAAAYAASAAASAADAAYAAAYATHSAASAAAAASDAAQKLKYRTIHLNLFREIAAIK